MALSKSMPPRKVSPPVEITSIDVVVELEHRGVEGAAAQVVDEHALLELAAEAIGERGGGGLVEDALHVEAREPARLAHRLALAVVVIGGHGDDRAGDLLAQLVLRHLAHLAQDERADLLQGIDPVAQPHRRLAVLARGDLIGEAVA